MHRCAGFTDTGKHNFISQLNFFNIIGHLCLHSNSFQSKKNGLNIACIILHDHYVHFKIDSINFSVTVFTSFAASNALMKAVPIIAPFAISQAVPKVCLSLIPKPTSIGLLSFKSLSFCKYFFTSLMFLSLPVVEEDDTAYKNPVLNSSNFFTLSSEVSGVTRKTKSNPCFFMIAPYSISYSYSGKSGTINPSTPTAAASAQNFSKPYCKIGFIYPINKTGMPPKSHGRGLWRKSFNCSNNFFIVIPFCKAIVLLCCITGPSASGSL